MTLITERINKKFELSKITFLEKTVILENIYKELNSLF